MLELQNIVVVVVTVIYPTLLLLVALIPAVKQPKSVLVADDLLQSRLNKRIREGVL
jgi:hypothetical protein